MSSLAALRQGPFQSGARRTTRLTVARNPWLALAAASVRHGLGSHLPWAGQAFPPRPGVGYPPYSGPGVWWFDPTTNSPGGLRNRLDEMDQERKPRLNDLVRQPEPFWDVLDELTGSFSGPSDWSANLDEYLYGDSD